MAGGVFKDGNGIYRSGSSQGPPLILPEGGGDPLTDGVPYGRISHAAKLLDDDHQIRLWQQRELVKGLLDKPYLLQTAQQVRDKASSLNGVVDQAMKGSFKAAEEGTYLHAVTEQLDDGDDVANIPPEFAPDLASYLEATHDWEPVMSEVFVVLDDLRFAGSFDRMWRAPDGGLYIGDLKTGASAARFHAATARQLAAYSHGMQYNPETGERTPLPSDLNQEVGMLVHMPVRKGKTDIYELDIATGWSELQLAAQVQAKRYMKRPKAKLTTIGGK